MHEDYLEALNKEGQTIDVDGTPYFVVDEVSCVPCTMIVLLGPDGYEYWSDYKVTSSKVFWFGHPLQKFGDVQEEPNE